MTGLGGYDSKLLAQLTASAYVVQATITQLHASTVTGPVDPDHTVIAHVDNVVYQNAEMDSLGHTWGDTITIDVKGPDVAVGQHLFLLTDLADYAGQLEVVELGRVDTGAHPNAATDLPKIEALFAANPLYARVATSSAIVSGVVASTASTNMTCVSEHCPDWQTSNVTVDDVLCGSSDATAHAGFAGSNDVAWAETPKLTAGQQGVLLLHQFIDPFQIWAPDPQDVVLAPLDVHDVADRGAIDDLLANPPALQ